MFEIITDNDIELRFKWINEIESIKMNFIDSCSKIEKNLIQEIKQGGVDTLLAHLRLCGDIPEQYAHDSSVEKLYSKYTDILIAEAYKFLGFKSLVLSERADAADVDVYADSYSFIADAKAFRLSRTAKNQKDFKIQAMDSWKRGKPFAMVVSPIYQLPIRASQIYTQSINRNVCIFTYSHLAVLVAYHKIAKQADIKKLIFDIFQSINSMMPSKDAQNYWRCVNEVILKQGQEMNDLWKKEKIAAYESIKVASDNALKYLYSERERIVRLSREDAINALLKSNKIDNKINIIENISDNRILDVM